MKQPKLIKLIPGNMNIPYIQCKAGYAEGSNKPRRVVKQEVKPMITKLRKNEKLVA